jgi:hypothetical protein
MIKESDLYTCTLQSPLTVNDVAYGTAYTRYEVRQVTDIRNLTEVKAYRIACTQRLVIPNPNSFSLTPSNSTSFDNYPALLSAQFELVGQTSSNVRLLNYSPRTINTTITASANQSEGQNQSYSRQHTTGSSTSQTNTFGYSASIGFFGEDPTGSFGMDQSNSTTTEQSTSNTTGIDRGRSSERGDSDSMSVKDWASYVYLDAGNTTPTWVWGQEYPWDVIQYRYCPTDNNVELPAFIVARLFDQPDNPTLVFPPSQLSLFGIDFTMKAVWQVDLPSTIGEQTISIAHTVYYLSGSHGISNGQPSVTLDPAPMQTTVSSPTLDLTLLGLDPIRDGSAQNGAVIGFIPSKFVVPPSSGSAFKVLSDANNLQVSGAGFDSPMLTTFANGAVSLRVQFKIVDGRYAYTLFMKHWKTSDNGCTLSFVFNGDTANPVIRHIDWQEGEGGEDNLSSIVMRNKDYTSIDYHDYLVMGLNTVDITITPDNSAAAGYFLRALAVGED